MTCVNCGSVSTGINFCTMCGTNMTVPFPRTPAGAAFEVETRWEAFPRVQAAFMARFFAFLIDETLAGLLAATTYGIMSALAAGISLGSLHGGSASSVGISLLVEVLGVPLAVAIYGCYFVMQETGTQQATLGKRLLGIRITGLRGERISVAQSIGRLLIKNLLSGELFLLGFLMAAFTERKQALHDMVASTLVVPR